MKFFKHLLIATAFFAATQAYAVCTPATGTTGNDIVACTGTISGILELKEGDDTVNATGATFSTYNERIEFDADGQPNGDDTLNADNSHIYYVEFDNSDQTGGADTLVATDNSIIGSASMGGGDDSVNVTNSTITYLYMADGNDNLTVSNGTFERIYLENGDDIVNADGITVTTSYWTELGTGDDEFIIKNGNFTGAIRDTTGNDTITLTDTVVGTNVIGDFIKWETNIGDDDIITLDNSSVGASIWGERIHLADLLVVMIL